MGKCPICRIVVVGSDSCPKCHSRIFDEKPDRLPSELMWIERRAAVVRKQEKIKFEKAVKENKTGLFKPNIEKLKKKRDFGRLAKEMKGAIDCFVPQLGPTPQTWNPCPGTYHSRLQVGDQAYVSNDPPLANRVRKNPGMTGKIIGVIQPLEGIEILDGPECADNWVWWKVRSLETGLTGWTAEGDENGYWLLPIQSP